MRFVPNILTAAMGSEIVASVVGKGMPTEFGRA
jgi:hypothetical protein